MPRQSSTPPIERICETCGKPFRIWPYQVGRAMRCSQACRMMRVQRECAQCGKPFMAKAKQMRAGTGHFCSRSCTAKHRKGELSSSWKGGRRLNDDGYVLIDTPDGARLEHRVVMERDLGRALSPDESVHHLSRCKTDNRPWNLVVMTPSEHAALHRGKGERWSRDFDSCVECGGTDRKHVARGFCAYCYHHVRAYGSAKGI